MDRTQLYELSVLVERVIAAAHEYELRALLCTTAAQNGEGYMEALARSDLTNVRIRLLDNTNALADFDPNVPTSGRTLARVKGG